MKIISLLLLGGIGVFIFREKLFGSSFELPSLTAKDVPTGDSSVSKGDTIVLPTDEYNNVMAKITPNDEVVVDDELLDATRQRIGTDASATWWNEYTFEDGGSSGFDFSAWIPEGLIG